MRHQIDLKYGANQVPPLAAPNKTKSKGSQGAGAFCDEARPPAPQSPTLRAHFTRAAPGPTPLHKRASKMALLLDADAVLSSLPAVVPRTPPSQAPQPGPRLPQGG